MHNAITPTPWIERLLKPANRSFMRYTYLLVLRQISCFDGGNLDENTISKPEY